MNVTADEVAANRPQIVAPRADNQGVAHRGALPELEKELERLPDQVQLKQLSGSTALVRQQRVHDVLQNRDEAHREREVERGGEQARRGTVVFTSFSTAMLYACSCAIIDT